MAASLVLVRKTSASPWNSLTASLGPLYISCIFTCRLDVLIFMENMKRLLEGGESKWHWWHTLKADQYTLQEPQAGVRQAVVSLWLLVTYKNASGSFVFLCCWLTFNWFLIEVRFILVKEMEALGFLICRSLDLSPESVIITIMWLL